jgi:MFS family permease
VAAAGVVAAIGSFDVAALSTVLPALGAQFGAAPSDIQWVMLAYLLPITALTMPAGRWLDGVGRRSSVLFLLAGFSVCNVLAALSQNLGELIAARALQGVFGAGTFAIVTVLAFESVEPRRRALAIAVVSTVAPIGGILGPTAGGLIAELAGWHWIFVLNALAAALVIPVFAVTIPRGPGLRWPVAAMFHEVALLGGAATCVLLGLTWAPTYGPGWLALCILAIPLVALWRRTHPDAPLLVVLKTTGMGSALLVLAAVGASFMAVQYLVAYLAQRFLGMSVAETGVIILFLSGSTVLLSPLAGYLAGRFGPRRVAAFGLLLMTVGAASLTPADPGWTVTDLAWRLILVGIGNGLASGPAALVAMSIAPMHLIGSAGSASSFVKNIGFTVGPSAATMIWASMAYSSAGMSWALLTAAVAAIAGLLVIATDRVRRLSRFRPSSS